MSEPPTAGEPPAAPGRPRPAGGATPEPPVEEAPADPGEAPAGDAPEDAVPDEGARRARAERAVRGTLSGALVLEALMVLFVPRAIAPLSDAGLTGGRLAFLLGLAGALIVASVLQRRRIGLVLGTVLQLPVIATGFLIGVMFVLGLIFAGVWLYLLRLRRELLGPARPAAAS